MFIFREFARNKHLIFNEFIGCHCFTLYYPNSGTYMYLRFIVILFYVSRHILIEIMVSKVTEKKSFTCKVTHEIHRW